MKQDYQHLHLNGSSERPNPNPVQKYVYYLCR